MASSAMVALDVPTVMALTFTMTGLVKPFLELLITPANPVHDRVIQLVAIAFGIGWSIAFTAAAGPLSPSAALNTVATVVLGIAGGTGSVGAYHVASSVTSANGPGTPPSSGPPP
jgi:hypothetical protein